MFGKLQYFALRAKGELPRLLLEYTQTPYDSVMHFASGGHKAFAPFGQMPCYMGPELGDAVLAQSSAICRHIAREAGICGSTKSEQAFQDMLWETGNDISSKLELVHADGPVDKVLDGIFQGIIKIMDQGKFLSGTNPGYGEVGVFNSLYHISQVKPDFLDSYLKLKMFMEKVKEIPSIAEYLKSARHLPLTENELGKGFTGLTGFKYINPLNPEVMAEKYSE